MKRTIITDTLFIIYIIMKANFGHFVHSYLHSEVRDLRQYMIDRTRETHVSVNNTGVRTAERSGPANHHLKTAQAKDQGLRAPLKRSAFILVVASLCVEPNKCPAACWSPWSQESSKCFQRIHPARAGRMSCKAQGALYLRKKKKDIDDGLARWWFGDSHFRRNVCRPETMR